MLRTLRIRNFAIVESLELTVGPGLTVFTGETGAGKTILVEAIRFLLGGRTGSEMIRTGSEMATVEALFDPLTVEIPGIDRDVLSRPFRVRRELTGQGSARAFLGERQITRAQLAALGGHLADLCGQHQHQVLLDPDRHVEWLDRFAGTDGLAAQLRGAWADMSRAQTAHAELQTRFEREREQEELHRFQLAELRAAAVTPDEDERLRAEMSVLRNARRLAEAADQALAALAEDEHAVQTVLGRLRRDADNCAAIDPRWQQVAAPLLTAAESVQDAFRALGEYRERLTFDPARLDQIESRLAELYRLKTKYGGSCASICDRLRELEATTCADAALDAQLARLAEVVARHRDTVAALSAELSRRRADAAVALEAAIADAIANLGMAGARLAVELAPYTDGGIAVEVHGQSAHVREDGRERVRFLFEANPREGFKPLDRIASGGELSRLLLAFKSCGAPADNRMLYIFDEIDSGLGGQTAHAVARQIRALADHAQVFLISHLQQLAGVADIHFLIAKKTVAGRARVTVHALDPDARVRELARMVAGDAVTDRTLAFAAELTQPPRPSRRRR